MDQPYPLPWLVLEPQSVRLAVMQPGFQLTWEDLNRSSVQQHVAIRIEVLSSVNPQWTTLMVLKNGESRFAFPQPIDAEWMCFRVRSEINVFVSLWAANESLIDNFVIALCPSWAREVVRGW
jgi:hypothetical protein